MDIFEGIELADDVKKALSEKITTAFVPKSDFEAVNAKKEELLAETKKVKMSKKELEDAAEKARLEAAAKNGDIESLRKSYDEKLNELANKISGYENEKKSNALSSVSTEFVNTNVVDDPFVREALAQEFNKRMDLRDGNIVVLDPNGNLTALTVDDLKNEFMTNAKYAKLIVGSKASGGGATRADKDTGSSGQKSLSKIAITDKAARIAAIKTKLKN